MIAVHPRLEPVQRLDLNIVFARHLDQRIVAHFTYKHARQEPANEVGAVDHESRDHQVIVARLRFRKIENVGQMLVEVGLQRNDQILAAAEVMIHDPARASGTIRHGLHGHMLHPMLGPDSQCRIKNVGLGFPPVRTTALQVVSGVRVGLITAHYRAGP